MLGVDIGSSNLKTVLVDRRGNVIASAGGELTTSYPHHGWAEQDPEQWYRVFRGSLRRMLKTAGISNRDIASVCISAATHTPVLLDRSGALLRPAILWTDQRSIAEARWLNETHGGRIMQVGYHRANPTWTLPQLLWLSRHEPGVVEKAEKLFVAKDYLRYRLTGTWETDRIDALGTLMVDAAMGEWSEELCATIGWPMKTLPTIVNPTDVAGRVMSRAAGETGLLEGTPVVAGTSDTAAEVFGAGAVHRGQGVIKLATAANTAVMSHAPHPHARLFNYPHVIPGMWYTVAATSNCAAVHKWLRDRFFRTATRKAGRAEKDAFRLMDAMAATVAPGCEGLLFHPYLLGERSPYWDPWLRGDYLGITMRHGREHFVRALYEGIAFSILDCYQSLATEGLEMSEARIIGGGARSPLWRQVVCDVVGFEVLKPLVDDAAFGAALIGGVGVGLFSDEMDAVTTCVRSHSAHEPDPRRHQKYRSLFEIYKESQRRLVEINHRLHAFAQDGPEPLQP
jgi:xylulokinase